MELSYRITTFAYRHFNSTPPSYFSPLLCSYQTSRTLRRADEKLFKIAKRNLKSFCERSFSLVAPAVWDLLPAGLRDLPSLGSKPGWRLSSLDRPFHRLTMSVTRDYVYVCVHNYNVREWCVLELRVFVLQNNFPSVRAKSMMMMMMISSISRSRSRSSSSSSSSSCFCTFREVSFFQSTDRDL